MIFYGSSLSPFVRKVLAFAAEKGIELELSRPATRPGNPARSSSPRARCRKMPALRDGDFTLPTRARSSIISKR